MHYVDFPGTGEKVSALGLGSWVLGGENWGGASEEESVAAVRQAVACGVTLIDTAPFYGNGLAEKLIGRALKGIREKAFVATKCGIIRENGRINIDLSPASVLKEVDLSLGRLDCDAIDLYQCHWPDKQIPVEKTMETFLTLQARGKIRHIGVSNFDVTLLERALAVAPVRTLQVPCSLLERKIETEVLPFCREKGIGVIAYGVMGGGILTGKYDAPPHFDKSDARSRFYSFYEPGRFKNIHQGLEKLKAFGRPLNQVALNWVRSHSGVMTVLAGCRTPEQVLENAAALSWDLSREEQARIAEIGFV